MSFQSTDSETQLHNSCRVVAAQVMERGAELQVRKLGSQHRLHVLKAPELSKSVNHLGFRKWKVQSSQESWLPSETVYQGSLTSVMCCYRRRLSHDTPATAQGLMTVVWRLYLLNQRLRLQEKGRPTEKQEKTGLSSQWSLWRPWTFKMGKLKKKSL